MEKYLLAHDLGTSGNKATLYTIEGRLVKSKTYPYETRYFNDNWAEQNPHDWWKAVCHSTKELCQGIDTKNIESVCLSGQMMGCLCLDRNGNPLRNSIIYCDQRAIAETEAILKQIDAFEFYRIVGHRASAVYSIEKLMWVKNNEPDVYKNTHKMLNAKDYINYKMTGNMVTEYSDASGTNALDLNTLTWSDKIIDIAGVDKDKFPDLKKSIDVVGSITKEAAESMGLEEGIQVVAGGGDGVCAGVGVGCVKPGIAYNYVGSSSWINITSEKPFYDKHMRTMTWAHAVPGYLHPGGTMQTAGASYNWLKNEICKTEASEAEQRGISPYEIINEKIIQSVPGAGGIIFLPYLLGERSPRWNPKAKGAFIGLNLSHKREDVLRAVMEGITYNLTIILNIFKEVVSIESVVVIGGGAKGDVWRQIMADMYNTRILKPQYLEEATSMGAAIIGGVGVGVFDSFDVIDKFNKIESIQKPIESNKKLYEKMMPVFDECYKSLIDIYEKLAPD
jgi:xylulokinase